MSFAGSPPPASMFDSPPSSPLSMRSRSPTPPCDYPSPSLTQLSGSCSPSKSQDLLSSSINGDEPPPAKRRKIAEVKPRTTEYLDLRGIQEDQSPEEKAMEDVQLQRLLKALRKKQKIVVIAGAGISVSAGIPDFRSSTGLFTTLRSQHKLKASGKHLFDASVYRTDDSTASFHDMVRELSHMTQSAQPTLFHHMLATLAEEGRLLRLYTQNVDGIDTSMEPLQTTVPLNPKGPWPKTIQLHGGLEKMVCTKCGELSKFDGALFEGAEPPSCKACEEMEHLRTTMAGKRSHGIGRLRPRIVLYNEFNPDEEAIGAVTHADLRSRPDAVIVVGTSLKVPGVRRIAREMCAVARGRRDGFTAWINNGPEPVGTEFKDIWDLVVRGDCDEVARQVAIPMWDDKDIGEYSDVTGQDTQSNRVGIKVQVPSAEGKHKVIGRTKQIITPMSSPRSQSPAPQKAMKKLKQPKLNLGGASHSELTKKSKGSTNETTKRKASVKKSQTIQVVNKITSTFTTSKSTKSVSGKSTNYKAEADFKPVPVHSMFPNLINKAAAHAMTPISPAELRNNSDTSLHHAENPHDLKIEVPESPEYQLLLEQQQRRDIISPTGSIPKGMARFLE